MEEIFRSMRSNIQFVLKENQKVIVCTSSISGEGKSFISANLAMSFAILGKKVLLMGLSKDYAVRRARMTFLLSSCLC